MKKTKEGEPFDVVGFLLKGYDKVKEYLPEALSVLYDILPDNFPKDIGILYYNKEFRSFVDKYVGELPQKGKRAVLKHLKDGYPFLKGTIDRAIQKADLTDIDEEILKKGFSLKPKLGRKEDKGSFFPYLFFEDTYMKLLVRWIFYVWKGSIKVKRCKAGDCERIFIPYPNAPVEQKYCSEKCKNRIAKRRYRQRKELLSKS